MHSRNAIIISTASDNDLAKVLYNYLVTNLKPLKSNIEDFISLNFDEIEIVNHDGKISIDSLNEILTSFLQSDTAKFANYSINRFENILTIGVKTDLLKDMKICEYCGYMSRDYDDMYSHRLFCFSLTRLGS